MANECVCDNLVSLYEKSYVVNNLEICELVPPSHVVIINVVKTRVQVMSGEILSLMTHEPVEF